MLSIRSVAVLGVVLMLSSGAMAAEKGAKKQRKHHGVGGVVTAVEKDKDKDSGTISVQLHQHKKKGAAAATPATPVEKTFRVTDATKFEKILVKGKGKDQRTTEASTFAAVHKGEHVRIVAKDGDVAEKVDIVVREKKTAKNLKGAGKKAA